MMKAEVANLQTTQEKIPKGWRWVRLGEVAKRISKGESPEWQGFKYTDNGPRFVRSENVLWGLFGNEPQIFIPPEFHTKLTRSKLQSGDVLVNLVGASIGRACVVPEGLGEANVNQAVGVITPDKELDAEFLVWFIISPQIRAHFQRVQVNMARPNISLENLRELLVPLPPLAEQQHIAAILNEQMAAINKTREAVETQIGLTTSLIDSYLRESLSDSNARSLLLNDCLTEVARGVGENWEDYRVIGATRGGLAPAKASVGKFPERYKLVDKGTIFYNPMRILIGSIGMVDEDDEPGITSPDYVVFKTQSGIVHPKWFYYWLRSSFGAAFIKTLARGAVRERILFQRLANAEILLPSWDMQVKVAEKLSAIAQLRQSLEEQLTAVNDLPEKLLHRAFNGEV